MRIAPENAKINDNIFLLSLIQRQQRSDHHREKSSYTHYNDCHSNFPSHQPFRRKCHVYTVTLHGVIVLLNTRLVPLVGCVLSVHVVRCIAKHVRKLRRDVFGYERFSELVFIRNAPVVFYYDLHFFFSLMQPMTKTTKNTATQTSIAVTLSLFHATLDYTHDHVTNYNTYN